MFHFDKRPHAFCLLKNSGRLLIVKAQSNMPSVVVYVHLVMHRSCYSFSTHCQSVNLSTLGDYKLQNQSNTHSLIKLCSGVMQMN